MLLTVIRRRLAVKYLFQTTNGEKFEPDFKCSNSTPALNKMTTRQVKPSIVNSLHLLNGDSLDYQIPWALRDLIADPRVMEYFSDEVISLSGAFKDWHPKTAILKEVKKKLQPVTRLAQSSSFVSKPTSISKL